MCKQNDKIVELKEKIESPETLRGELDDEIIETKPSNPKLQLDQLIQPRVGLMSLGESIRGGVGHLG